MAGWLESSFGDPVNLDNMKPERNDVQSAAVSTEDFNRKITRAIQNTNRGTTNTSAQDKPQHFQTCQDQSKEINETNPTLPLVPSDHSVQKAGKSTTNNEDTTKPSTTCPPNDNRSSNEAVRNQAGWYSPVQKKSRMYHVKQFLTPKNWEMQKIRKLGSLTKKDQCVNVFAVVSYFYPPKHSEGSHMYFHFGLVDQTLYQNDNCLKCICFQTYEQDMPLITNIGDIVKFPLRISRYRDSLQGRTFDDQFPWMTFSGRPNAPIVPRYSRCSAPTFTDADKKKVEELKSWAASVGIITATVYVTLAELARDMYFDFLCQVVYADSQENVLYVWDGTEPSFKGLLHSPPEMFCSATKWGEKVMGRCVKVRIYGCDVESTYKPGQYILIPSLHFILKDVASDDENEGVTQTPFLTLHERMLSRRGIEILDSGDRDVKMLEQRMEMLVAPPTHESCQSPGLTVTKIPKSPKTAEEDAAKVNEIPVGKVQPFTAIQDTGNKKSRMQESTITAANVATTNQVLRTSQAKRQLLSESCTSNLTIVKPVVNEIRTSLAIIPPMDAPCISGGVPEKPGVKAGAPPADDRRDVHTTNHSAKPCVEKSCASSRTLVKPADIGVKNVAASGNSSRRVHGSQDTRSHADEGCASNKATSRPAAKDGRETPRDMSEDLRTKLIMKSSVDESCKKALSQAVVKGIDDPRASSYTIRDIRNGKVPAKFACCATVRYFMPKEPKQFVKYACKSCQQHYGPFDVGVSKNNSSTIVKCINPKCGAALSLTVEFSVILHDGTGLLDVTVSDVVARKFLPSPADPVKLLTSENIQKIVVDFLRSLKRYCIEFEIKRFAYPNGRFVYSLTKWNAAQFKPQTTG